MSSSVELQLAIADLNASRARLREVLIPPPRDPNAPPGKGLFSGLLGGVLGNVSGTVSSLWRSWTGSGNSASKNNSSSKFSGASAALSFALTALRSWWGGHPWRQMGRTVGAPLGDAAVPLVRRHPWASVAIASVAGAVLVQLRPWRWSLVARQAHLARRQAVHWAFAQATKPAMQALLATAVAGLVSRMNDKKSSKSAVVSTPAAGQSVGALRAPPLSQRPDHVPH